MNRKHMVGSVDRRGLLECSRKNWRELNLAVEPQNHHYENIGGFKFGGCTIDRQTAKFNSLPNFPAIWYL